MSRSHPEFPGSNRCGPSAAADVLVREEPDEEEEEDEEEHDGVEDEDEDEGYSE